MIEHKVWVTTKEFSRIMGRTPQWARKYAPLGTFVEFGIPTLMSISQRKGDPRCWYFLISEDLIDTPARN